MNFKRFTSCLLSLIIAGSLCTSALADNDFDDTDTPYDTSAISDTFFEVVAPTDDISLQAETEEQIDIVDIEINSADDLKKFRDEVNSYDKDVYLKAQFATVNLNCDIDLDGEEWIPIGYAPEDTEKVHSFKGTFNGNNHAISNFKLTNPNYLYMGLFASVWNARKSAYVGYENDISISNLTLDNVKINVEDTNSLRHVGILSGASYIPNVYKNITVKNADIKINKTGYDDVDNTQISCGMISGYGSYSAYDCNVQGNIDVTSTENVYIGGITGLDGSATSIAPHTYSNCTSSVNITSSATYQNIVGGIAGYVRSNTPITNCHYNTDKGIDISCAKDDKGVSQAFAGGIAGHCYSPISGCTVSKTSSIKSTSDEYAGSAGISLYCDQDIKNCVVSSDLTALATEGSSLAYVGGIVCVAGTDTSASSPISKTNSVIENCIYNGQNLTVNSYGNILSGGIAARLADGYSLKNSYAEFNALNATSLGLKAAKKISYAGGLVGDCQGSSVSNCFAKGDITTKSNYTIYTGGLTGRIGDLTYYVLDDTDQSTIKAIHSPGVLSDSYTTSSVTASGNSVYAGGISGYLTSSSKIEDNTQSSITKSHSSGNVDVTAASTSLVGGGVGYTIDSYISDCYSTGDLTIKPTSATVYGGGFVGRLKEANIAWENTENPLSQTINCYTSGNVIIDASSPKVAVGPFAQLSVSNLSQKPSIEVAPLYKNCYYISDEETEKAVGSNISDIIDKNSFDFDFKDIWKMTENGPVLLVELPEVCDVDYTYENGEPIKINSVTVGTPNKVNKIYVTTTNTVTYEKNTTVYEVPTVSAFEKYFKTIDIDYEISPLTTVEVSTTEPVTPSYELTYPKLENNVFTAKITNNLDTDATILNFAAAYSSDGVLADKNSSSVVLKANETTNIELEVPNDTSKIFIWDLETLSPIIPSITY